MSEKRELKQCNICGETSEGGILHNGLWHNVDDRLTALESRAARMSESAVLTRTADLSEAPMTEAEIAASRPVEFGRSHPAAYRRMSAERMKELRTQWSRVNAPELNEALDALDYEYAQRVTATERAYQNGREDRQAEIVTYFREDNLDGLRGESLRVADTIEAMGRRLRGKT